MKKILQQVKRLEFVESLRLSAKGGPKILLIIVLDAAFFLISILAKNFAESSIRIGEISNNQGLLIKIAVLLIVYYASMLLVYSFFKLCILSLIKSLVTKTKLSIRNIGRFYLLNMLLAVIVLITSALLGLLLSSAKESYIQLAQAMIFLPYIAIIYIFLNLSHSVFIANGSIKSSMEKGLKLLGSPRVYIGIVFPSLLITLIFSLSYSLIYLKANAMLNAFIIAFEGIFYLIFLINRTGFYLIAQKQQ